MKSERLKKLETELNDLDKWMKLGLVPKKEIEKHKDEIENLKSRIEEEKERLMFLKENGEIEDFVAPKRNQNKAAYPETPSISEIDFDDQSESDIEVESDPIESDLSDDEKDDSSNDDYLEEENEDPFSDRNRWRRGGIMDPDANDW